MPLHHHDLLVHRARLDVHPEAHADLPGTIHLDREKDQLPALRVTHIPRGRVLRLWNLPNGHLERNRSLPFELWLGLQSGVPPKSSQDPWKQVLRSEPPANQRAKPTLWRGRRRGTILWPMKDGRGGTSIARCQMHAAWQF